MAKISKEKGRLRQFFCLKGHFVSRSKPFWRPQDLTHFAHGRVGKLGHRTTMPSACRLALCKMASNLDGLFNRS